jgi:hypothetical protein
MKTNADRKRREVVIAISATKKIADGTVISLIDIWLARELAHQIVCEAIRDRFLQNQAGVP